MLKSVVSACYSPHGYHAQNCQPGFHSYDFLVLGSLRQRTRVLGSLCVLRPDAERIDEVLRAARRYGANLAPSPSGDGACLNNYPGGKAVEVPSGLESWTRQLMAKIDYRVEYQLGTAGGSAPIEDVLLHPSDILSEPVTPESLDRVCVLTRSRAPTQEVGQNRPSERLTIPE
jgi:hypothetical protein